MEKKNDIQTKDAYEIFLNRLKIEEEALINFGLEETIYPDNISINKVTEQWNNLKDSLSSNKEVYIRQFGQTGENNPLFKDFIKYIFGNDNIKIDPSRNSIPTKVLEEVTGLKKNKSISNYQVSHTFGMTKNPLLFTAAWNLAFIPKLMGPFTGHESSGKLKNKYEQEYQKVIKSKFKECIEEYNEIIDGYNVSEKIEEFINLQIKSNKYPEKFMGKFKKDLSINFAKIPLD